MKKYTLIFLVAVFSMACEAQTGVTHLKPAEFVKASENQWLVDVRTPQEFATDHLKGAQNVDINGPSFQSYFEKGDREKPVYLYCRSGSRSSYAAKILSNMGYTKIYNMVGGLSSYR